MRTSLVIGSLVFASFLAACGDDSSPGDSSPADSSPDGSDAAADAGGTVALTARDLSFSTAKLTSAPGDIEVTLTNEGQIEHTWTVDGHEDELTLDTPNNGTSDTGTITLPAGTYTYYCDVPGHRGAGMEGTLTVG